VLTLGNSCTRDFPNGYCLDDADDTALDARLQHFGCPNALLIMHEFAINQRSHKPHSLTAKTRLLTGVGTAVRYYFVIRA
jgi:hypothetical protein